MASDMKHPDVHALSDYLEGRLRPQEEAKLRCHLDACSECDRLLQAIIEEDAAVEEGPPRAIWGRPVAGPEPGIIPMDRDLWMDLLQTIESEDQWQRIVVLPFEHTQERQVLGLLQRLAGHFQIEGRPVEKYMPTLRAFLPLHKARSPDARILVHHAPRFPGIEWFLQAVRHRAGSTCPVILSGLTEELRGSEVLRSVPEFRVPFSTGGTDHLAQDLPDLADELDGSGISDLYLYTAHLDAYGIPMPTELLSRLVGKGQGWLELVVAQSAPILDWATMDDLREPWWVVTQGEALARMALSEFFPECDSTQIYERILLALEPANNDERYTALKLLKGFISRHRSGLARALLGRNGECVDALIRGGGPREFLAWGQIFEQLGDLQRGERILQAGLKRDPSNIYLLHALGHLYARWAESRGDEMIPKSRECFRKAHEIDPDNVYVLQSWGDMESKLGRARDGEAHLRQALEQDRTNVRVLVALADHSLRSAKPDRAERFLEEAEKDSPGNAYVIHMRGEVCRRTGDYETARSLYRQAARFATAEIPALTSLGVMACERGHFAEAEHWLQRAAELAPDSVSPAHAYGKLWAERAGRRRQDCEDEGAEHCHRQAAAQFERVLEIDEDNRPARFELAELALAQSDERRFEELVRQCPELGDTNDERRKPRVLGLSAKALESKGRSEELLELAAQLAECETGSAAPLVQAAQIAAAHGKLDEAHRWFESARYHAEDCGSILDQIITLNAYAVAEAARGDLEQAHELINESLGLDRENTYTIRAQARVLHAAGQHDEAEARLRKAGELEVMPCDSDSS